jgi:4-amino-4-deoxy-L-arabinose transferase-like glycosyltransferase
MSPETFLVAGYAGFLLGAAVLLEWLSAHTHRRSLRYRTAGFTYHEQHDHWECPEGQHLWPHEFDHEQRLVRYRAKAHICNGCPRKEACTDSDHGREIVRPLDPWPHSEAGRFHRGLSLMLVVLAVLVIIVGAVRDHSADDAALQLVLLALALAIGRWLWRDFRAHPAGFPTPSAGHGLRMRTTGADGEGEPSRWGSQNRTGGSPR